MCSSGDRYSIAQPLKNRFNQTGMSLVCLHGKMAFNCTTGDHEAKPRLASALAHPSFLLPAAWLLCPISMAAFAVAMRKKGEGQLSVKV